MIVRVRSTRILLSACALPLGAVQVGLLSISIFLHAPGEADAAGLASVSATFHHHDFRLTAAGDALSEDARQCPACGLQRNPAAMHSASSAVSAAALETSVPPFRDTRPADPPVSSNSPRAPPGR